MIRTAILFTIAAFGIAPVFGASACESLTALKLQNVSITGAAAVAAGAFTSPLPPAKGKQTPSFKNLPAFCRVSATLTPSSDSEIRIEVWLPESGWNGNLQSVGNGAWAALADQKVGPTMNSIDPNLKPLGGSGDRSAEQRPLLMIDALSKWVEQGKAPDRIEASRVRGGQTDRTRPLCPYPQVAVYKGSGSTDDSANFSCKVQ